MTFKSEIQLVKPHINRPKIHDGDDNQHILEIRDEDVFD
jgi:hypothetical protein